MDNTLQFLKNISQPWITKMFEGSKWNYPISIGIGADEAELMTGLELKVRGTGSISHGFDHSNRGETKILNLVQPKECKECKSKIHFFSETCVNCGSTEFNYKKDTRWSIDVDAHFNHNVSGYYLWAFEPVEYNNSVKDFNLKMFFIDSNNENFIQVLNKQRESGAKQKNLLPYKSDFYVSNPIMKSFFNIRLDNVYGTIINRREVEEIKYNNEIIKILKPYLPKDFLSEKEDYSYKELSEYFNISNKKTSHGKDRGKTKRRIK